MNRHREAERYSRWKASHFGILCKKVKKKQKQNINLRITETPYLSKNMTLHVLLVLHQIEAAGDKQEKYVMEYLKVGM